VLPEPGGLFAWVHQPVGDADVDEAALHRHPRGKRKRRDHPADGLGQPQRLSKLMIVTEAGMAADQLDQIDRGNAQNRTGEAVIEAGDQRCEVTAEGDAVQPDLRVGLL
jgi:hypothetical protein